MKLQTNRLIKEIGRRHDIEIVELCLARLADAHDVFLDDEWHLHAMNEGWEPWMTTEHPYTRLLKAIAYDLRAAAYQKALRCYQAVERKAERLEAEIELRSKEEEQ